MDALVVTKADNLSGKIRLKGAKNSILPILAACVLTRDEVLLSNCPSLSDIDDMLGIMRSLGATVNVDGGDIYVRCKDIDPSGIDRELMSKIRSSIFILGPLLARSGEAEISMPGGCEIGKRPIDLHLSGLRKLGVAIDEIGDIRCKGVPSGGIVELRYPSVGATENLMMAGALGEGRTTIYGSAREPEIVDLANFLNTLGARVYGAGSSLIVIDGKKRLHGGRFKPISDRIVAGTYMTATAVCGGDVYIEGAIGDHLDATANKLRAAGAHIIEEEGGVRVYCHERLRAVPRTVTLPYPGFSTDMQPILTAALATADGVSVMTETLFENRFRYAGQLALMGAEIRVEDDHDAVIEGRRLHGADVMAQDLRGGAALTVAALAADGITVVRGAEHIDRGYESIENDLNLLGAGITRIKEKK